MRVRIDIFVIYDLACLFLSSIVSKHGIHFMNECSMMVFNGVIYSIKDFVYDHYGFLDRNIMSNFMLDAWFSVYYGNEVEIKKNKKIRQD